MMNEQISNIIIDKFTNLECSIGLIEVWRPAIARSFTKQHISDSSFYKNTCLNNNKKHSSPQYENFHKMPPNIQSFSKRIAK